MARERNSAGRMLVNGQTRAVKERRAKRRKELYDLSPWCAYCRRPLRFAKTTLDHIVPLKKGGYDLPGNFVLSCKSCNDAKGGRTLQEWIEDLIKVYESV